MRQMTNGAQIYHQQGLLVADCFVADAPDDASTVCISPGGWTDVMHSFVYPRVYSPSFIQLQALYNGNKLYDNSPAKRCTRVHLHAQAGTHPPDPPSLPVSRFPVFPGRNASQRAIHRVPKAFYAADHVFYTRL